MSVQFNGQLIQMLNNLNRNFYEEFLNSMKLRNISSDIQVINRLAHMTHFNQINLLQKNFNEIDRIFKEILQYNSQLSNEFLLQTLNQVENQSLLCKNILFFLVSILFSKSDSIANRCLSISSE